jgi:hypothetical protein
LTEALARIRNDSVLSRPAKASAAGRALFWRVAERARKLPPRVYVGAALSAFLAGIGLNAVVMQRGRHPAPLFAPAKPQPRPEPASAPRPPAPPPPVAETRIEPPAAAPVLPPVHPQAAATPRSRSADPIGDLLRGEQPGEGANLVLTAQNALIKLGYAVKPDGDEGAATRQALREFERAHKLPASTEITSHLVRELAAAAKSAGR